MNPEHAGTKAAPLNVVDVPARGEIVLKLRLTEEAGAAADVDELGSGFDAVFANGWAPL